MMKFRSAIALMLMLCMLISILPAPAVATEEAAGSSSLTATEIPGLSRLEGTDYNANPTENYADDETVDVIIVMEDPAVLEDFRQSEADDGQTAGEAVAEFLASQEAAARTELLLQAQSPKLPQV